MILKKSLIFFSRTSPSTQTTKHAKYLHKSSLLVEDVINQLFFPQSYLLCKGLEPVGTTLFSSCGVELVLLSSMLQRWSPFDLHSFPKDSSTSVPFFDVIFMGVVRKLNLPTASDPKQAKSRRQTTNISLPINLIAHTQHPTKFSTEKFFWILTH